MKLLISLAVAAAFAQPVSAACSYPKAPEKVPDGSTATREEMLAGQKVVKDYDQQINGYLSCLKLEYDSFVAKNGDKLNAEQKQKLDALAVQKNNAAVEAVETLAARFNEQLKIYKARNDSKG